MVSFLITNLNKIDKRMKRMKVPSDVGRIANCISDAYKRMKADEWKHWTLVYSMYCLQGVINQCDLNIWSLFVYGCTLLCKRAVTLVEVEKAHSLLKMFCDQFVCRYGKDACVPNMHLMLHLRQCITEFGSVYGFWCFSFKQFNGVMGMYHTNNNDLAIQVMRKFVTNCNIRMENEELLQTNTDVRASQIEALMQKVRHNIDISGFDLEFMCENILSVARRSVVCQLDMESINVVFSKMYGESFLRIATFMKKVTRIDVLHEVVATNAYRGGNSPYSFIIARYPTDTFVFDTNIERPAIVNAIYEVQVIRKDAIVEEKIVKHLILKCQWFKVHTHKNFYGVSCPMKLWSTEFEPYSPKCFIPAKVVHKRFVCCKEEIVLERIGNIQRSDTVNIVIPLPSRSILS